MMMRTKSIAVAFTVVVGLSSSVSTATADKRDPKAAPPGVLWTDPGDVSRRNLRYGPGGAELEPQPPFTFVEEDTGGTSPKFRAKDARGTVWQVKLGIESQVETVVTRLLWAVGYFADEAYFLHEVPVAGLTTLMRGNEWLKPGGVLMHARFEPRREGTEKLDTWEWEDNPFVGTRELDGLKVMMMLLNNWDARDANNAIVQVARPDGSTEIRYLVSDLGAALGKAGGKGTHSKNDVADFAESKFVAGVEQGIVKFHYSVRPKGLGMFAIIYPPYVGRIRDIEETMEGIKVEHARWIGSLLSQLTDEQLRDAFTAAWYPEESTTAYMRALRARFQQLVDLEDASGQTSGTSGSQRQ
jgi:hypothetical protein